MCPPHRSVKPNSMLSPSPVPFPAVSVLNLKNGSKLGSSARGRMPMHAKGDGGLYLLIGKAGVLSWSFRFVIAARTREAGLGQTRDVSLAQASNLAYEMRQQKRHGVDPQEARRANRQGATTARSETMTFRRCPKTYIAAQDIHRRASAVMECQARPAIGAVARTTAS